MTKLQATASALAASLLSASCSDSTSAPVKGYLRLGQFSPDTPSVDFCLAPAGTGAFTGPILKEYGIAAGLAYGQVTTYLPLDPASYDVRIVAGEAPTCAASLLDVTDLPAVPPNGYVTAALVGLTAAPPALEVRFFADEHGTSPGKANVRFLHAAPGQAAVSAGLLSGNAFTADFENVAYPTFATESALPPGSLDSRGYVSTSPILNGVFEVQVASSATVLGSVPNVNAAAGKVLSLFLVGLPSGTPALAGLVCADLDPPVGAFTNCSTSALSP